MKIKTTLIALSSLLAGVVASNAAGIMVVNISAGPGDTLYATSTNTLMNSGMVTMGYFPSTITTADIDTLPELLLNLNSYTTITSARPGSPNTLLGSSNPGYVDQADFTSIGNITGVNPLLGRMLYSIVTNGNTLTGNTEYALLAIGAIKDDVPVENQYVSNPTGLAPIIGTIGAFNGDAGAGPGTYGTLKMLAVPEASTALLGALGALGLLRRRR
jgi:hypothetical protein